MNISDAIDAIKSFFLDIIGYFIPGFFAIVVLDYCVRPDFKYDINNLGVGEEWNQFLIIFFSYIIGHVIYSASDFVDWIIRKLKFLNLKSVDSIESDIEKSHEVEIARVALRELMKRQDGSPAFDEVKFSSLKARNLRSIVMSYIPESDTKIYTFMFRSELCKNISCFAFLFGSFSLLSLMNSWNSFVILDGAHISIYFLLIICSYFLAKTRMRFLAIAYKIPFSIFISKFFAIK